MSEVNNFQQKDDQSFRWSSIHNMLSNPKAHWPIVCSEHALGVNNDPSHTTAKLGCCSPIPKQQQQLAISPHMMLQVAKTLGIQTGESEKLNRNAKLTELATLASSSSSISSSTTSSKALWTLFSDLADRGVGPIGLMLPRNQTVLFS